MASYFIVANPVSGNNKSQEILNDFIRFLQKEQIDYAVKTTTIEKNARTIVEESFNHDNLVIVGGDGTINEAINGLGKRVPIGIIPSGTGNDFVKNISIGKDRDEVFKTSVSGSIVEIDAGSCNGRLFLNGIGVGFDGQIVANMENNRTRFLSGHAEYYYHVLKILATYKARKIDIELEGKTQTKNLILLTVANGTTFGGGFKLAPKANICDGLLDVCEIGRISGLKRFLNIHRLQAGTHGKMNAVNQYCVKQVTIGANHLLEGHIDGEYMGQPPFEVSILPKALLLRTSS